jgi:hypothetical protein
MSFGIILPHRWRRQPTSPVGIDWSHPLARHLRHVWFCGDGQNRTRCLVTGTQLVPAGGVFTSRLGIEFGNGFSWSATLSKSFVPPVTFVVGLRYRSDAVLWSVGPSSPAWTGYYIQNSDLNVTSTNSTDFSGSVTPADGGLYQINEAGATSFIALTMSGANDLRASRNGGIVGADTSCAAPTGTLSTLRIGLSPNASNFGAGDLLFFAALDAAVPDVVLRSLSAEPWQFFRPIQRRIYVPSAGTGGGTGTLAVTLGGLTSTASGTLAIKGTSAVTLGALTSTAAGKLDIKGTSAVTLGALTSTASGTLMSAGTGTAAITLAALTATAAGKLEIKGTAAATLGSVTLAASGVVAAGPNGNAAITLGALTSTAVGKLTISGTSAVTLGSLTSAATGAVAIKGVAGISLGSLTVAALGLQITSDTRIGSAAITLGDLTVDAMSAPLVARLGNRRLREGALRITKGALPTGRVKRGGLPRIS